jgi:hypothetical protein
LFHRGESAESFKFQQKALTDLFFYDRAQPKIVIGDFATGLVAANLQGGLPKALLITEVQVLFPMDGADSDVEGNTLEEGVLQAAVQPSKRKSEATVAIAAAAAEQGFFSCANGTLFKL